MKHKGHWATTAGTARGFRLVCQTNALTPIKRFDLCKTSLFITIKDDDLSPHASHYDAPKSLSINQKGDCTQFERELLVGVE